MDDAVYWDILLAIRDQLRSNVAFVSFGQVPQLKPEHIQIRMAPPYARKDDSTLWNVPKPGIVICPARTISVDGKGGAWSLDDVRYPVLIQVVDTEMSGYDEERCRSWLKWLEQIRKYVCHSNLKLAVFQDKGHVNITYCPTTETLDERLFYVHGSCVGLLMVLVEALEPRDPQATN
jgi:hypothetical protein